MSKVGVDAEDITRCRRARVARAVLGDLKVWTLVRAHAALEEVLGKTPLSRALEGWRGQG